jgi:hypothetical protein
MATGKDSHLAHHNDLNQRSISYGADHPLLSRQHRVELLGVSRAAAVAIFDSAWRNQPIS